MNGYSPLQHFRVVALSMLALSGPLASAGEKESPLDLGYYNGDLFHPVTIDANYLGVRFPATMSDAQMRDHLRGLSAVDVTRLDTARISEDRFIEAPLRGGLDSEQILALARRLDADVTTQFAAPFVMREEERQGLTNQIVVSMKKHVDAAMARQLAEDRGLTIVERLGYVEHGYLLELPKGSGKLTLDESRWFYEQGFAEWSVPDFVLERVVRYTPNDTYFSYQWHLHNTGQSGATVDADIDAVEAWDVTRGSASITIAIIDDGVETAHEDMSPNMLAGYDYLAGDNNPNPGSGDNHGTAVAGTAAARGGNGIGVAGVAHLCKILPIRLVGFGQTSTKEANAFTYAANNGADVINNSWGPADGTGSSQPIPSNVSAAINFAATSGRSGKGCVIMWAAGNGNESADLDGYASHPNVVSVAASTDFNVKASYSDFGSTVDVCAPSSGGTSWGIVTTDRTGSAGYSSTLAYTSGFGGTSAASPVACGVAALVLSVDSSLTRAEVFNILTSTADKIDTAGGAYNGAGHSNKYGYGKVNAKKAVDAAGSTPPPPTGGFVTFNSSDVPKAIPDNNTSGVASNLTVSGMSGSIVDYDVSVSISHTYKGDLSLYLSNPSGTNVQLHNKTGGSANDIITTYDTLTAPVQPLSNLFSGPANGTWRLLAFDTAAQDLGTITAWSLSIKTTGGGSGTGPTTVNYNAGDTPIAIPDNNATGINSFINVGSQSGSITEVNVAVNITHTYKGDLTLRLYHPSGTSVLLHNKTGGSTNDIITTYDTLTAPSQSLTAMNAKGANGQWRLSVTDTAGQDIGNLNSWSLQITTQ